MQFRLEADGDLVWLSLGLDRAGAAELIAELAAHLSSSPPSPPALTTGSTSHDEPAKTEPVEPARPAITGACVDALDLALGTSWRDRFTLERIPKGGGQRFAVSTPDGCDDVTVLRLLLNLVTEALALPPSSTPRSTRNALRLAQDRLRLDIYEHVTP